MDKEMPLHTLTSQARLHEHRPPHTLRLPAPAAPRTPSPQDSLRGLDFDRHGVIFTGADATPLSGLVAQRRTTAPAAALCHFRSTSDAGTEDPEGRGVFEGRSLEGL